MKYYFFIIIFIISLQQSCQVPSLDNNEKVIKNFFDLASFFKKEAQYLNDKEIIIKKRITHNNSTEEQIKQIGNWEKELKIFSDCDINKPSWKDRYILDSTLSDNGFKTLHYEAKDKKAPTQVIDIELLNKEVLSIVIINKETNNIFESQQYLTYIPGKSYSIKKIQDVGLIGQETYLIEVEYIDQ